MKGPSEEIKFTPVNNLQEVKFGENTAKVDLKEGKIHIGEDTYTVKFGDQAIKGLGDEQQIKNIMSVVRGTLRQLGEKLDIRSLEKMKIGQTHVTYATQDNKTNKTELSPFLQKMVGNINNVSKPIVHPKSEKFQGEVENEIIQQNKIPHKEVQKNENEDQNIGTIELKQVKKQDNSIENEKTATQNLEKKDGENTQGDLKFFKDKDDINVVDTVMDKKAQKELEDLLDELTSPNSENEFEVIEPPPPPTEGEIELFDELVDALNFSNKVENEESQPQAEENRLTSEEIDQVVSTLREIDNTIDNPSDKKDELTTKMKQPSNQPIKKDLVTESKPPPPPPPPPPIFDQKPSATSSNFKEQLKSGKRSLKSSKEEIRNKESQGDKKTTETKKPSVDNSLISALHARRKGIADEEDTEETQENELTSATNQPIDQPREENVVTKNIPQAPPPPPPSEKKPLKMSSDEKPITMSSDLKEQIKLGIKLKSSKEKGVEKSEKEEGNNLLNKLQNTELFNKVQKSSKENVENVDDKNDSNEDWETE